MKTCPICKAQLPDEAAFCNNCGANLSAPQQSTAPEPAPMSEAPVNNATYTEAVEKNKNTRIGMIAIIAGAAVVLLAIIIIIAVNVSGGSYKTPIQKLCKNVNKGNTRIESYLELCLPKFAMDTYKDIHSQAKKIIPEETAEYDENNKDYFADIFEDMRDEYGKHYKLSCEFREVEKISNHDLRELGDYYEELYDYLDDTRDLMDDDFYDDYADSMEDHYDVTISKADKKKFQKSMTSFMKNLKKMKIQEGYIVEVKFKVEGEKRDSEKMTLTIIKVDGKWICDPNSASNSFLGNSLNSLVRYGF